MLPFSTAAIHQQGSSGPGGSLTITPRRGQMATLANEQEDTLFSPFTSPVRACRIKVSDPPPDPHPTPADHHGHDLQGYQMDPLTQTSLETIAAGP